MQEVFGKSVFFLSFLLIMLVIVLRAFEYTSPSAQKNKCVGTKKYFHRHEKFSAWARKNKSVAWKQKMGYAEKTYPITARRLKNQ